MSDTKSYKLNSKNFENQSFSFTKTAQHYTIQSNEKSPVLVSQKYDQKLRKWPKIYFIIKREPFKFHPKNKLLKILPSWISIEKNIYGSHMTQCPSKGYKEISHRDVVFPVISV